MITKGQATRTCDNCGKEAEYLVHYPTVDECTVSTALTGTWQTLQADQPSTTRAKGQSYDFCSRDCLREFINNNFNATGTSTGSKFNELKEQLRELSSEIYNVRG